MDETQTATAPATTESPAPAVDTTSHDDSGHAEYNPDAALDSAILARLDESGATPTPDDVPPPTDPEPEPALPPAATDATPADADEDALAKELGIDPAKNNRIPYAKVKKILANAEKRLTEQHTAALGAHTSKIQTYEDRIAKVESVEQIMAAEPERFLKLLVEVNPAYAPLIGKAPPAAPTNGDDQEPAPDYDLGNGNFTYSVDGLKKRDAWRDRQTEARIFKRLDPILKRHDAEERLAQQGPIIRQKLERLQARPKFLENVDAINAALRANDTLSADDAYWQIVGPQLVEDANTMRARLLKEQQTIPRSTSVGVGSAAPKDAGDDLNAQIKARLKTMAPE